MGKRGAKGRAGCLLAGAATLIAGLLAAGPVDGRQAHHRQLRILYSEQKGTGNDYSIFSIKPSGEGREQLTHQPTLEFAPDVSPNGRKIAFTRETRHYQDIFVMNADGSHLRRLTHDRKGRFSREPSFSPDGKPISFLCLVFW